MSDDYKVHLPPSAHGSAEIRRIRVEGSLSLSLRGRGTQPGEFTALFIDGSLWMSDTQAEYQDHLEAIHQIRRRGGRILINGLGIGMVVKAALDCENVTHVDVVESNPDVIDLVGPSYAGPRCSIHEADAYSIGWPTGTKWSVAWHDVWQHISEDNLPGMERLHRRYGSRTRWQGSWCKEEILRNRRRADGYGFR